MSEKKMPLYTVVQCNSVQSICQSIYVKLNVRLCVCVCVSLTVYDLAFLIEEVFLENRKDREIKALGSKTGCGPFRFLERKFDIFFINQHLSIQNWDVIEGKQHEYSV